jgi:PhnB protein
VADDAQLVIDFLKTTFAAEQLRRFENPDGSIMHAEVRIDDTVMILPMPATNSLHSPFGCTSA